MIYSVTIEDVQLLKAPSRAATEQGLVEGDYIQQVVEAAVKPFIGQEVETISSLKEALRVSQARVKELEAVTVSIKETL